MSRSSNLHSLLRTVCLVACLCLMSGCEIGRSWFQMSSDSPTPFMGIDLLPRRRTTQLTPPQTGERYPSLAKNSVQQVVNRESQSLSQRVKDIRLPHISSLLKGEKEELLAFPESIGIDGIPTE